MALVLHPREIKATRKNNGLAKKGWHYGRGFNEWTKRYGLVIGLLLAALPFASEAKSYKIGGGHGYSSPARRTVPVQRPRRLGFGGSSGASRSSSSGGSKPQFQRGRLQLGPAQMTAIGRATALPKLPSGRKRLIDTAPDRAPRGRRRSEENHGFYI
jgi:hypothetical protein